MSIWQQNQNFRLAVLYLEPFDVRSTVFHSIAVHRRYHRQLLPLPHRCHRRPPCYFINFTRWVSCAAPHRPVPEPQRIPVAQRAHQFIRISHYLRRMSTKYPLWNQRQKIELVVSNAIIVAHVSSLSFWSFSWLASVSSSSSLILAFASHPVIVQPGTTSAYHQRQQYVLVLIVMNAWMVRDSTRVRDKICNVSIRWEVINAVVDQVSLEIRKTIRASILTNVIFIGRATQPSAVASICQAVTIVNVLSVRTAMSSAFREMSVQNNGTSVVRMANAFPHRTHRTVTIVRWNETNQSSLFLPLIHYWITNVAFFFFF